MAGECECRPPAGADHVGRRQQGRDQLRVRLAVGGDQGAVGQRDAQVLGLRSADADVLQVGAAALVAELASPQVPWEAKDDPIT